MGTIEEIIKAIDNELIKKNKSHLLLAQANDLLVSEKLMTVSERIDQKFKEILEENRLPHAYQTEIKPRQWRIPLSEEGKKMEKSLKKESPIKAKVKTQVKQPIKSISFNQNQKNVTYTICPICGINLSVPNEIANEAYISCLNCKNDIENPLVFGNKFDKSYNSQFSELQFRLLEQERLKAEVLKYIMYTTIGIGFFFPPIWIGTVILFFIWLLRKN